MQCTHVPWGRSQRGKDVMLRERNLSATTWEAVPSFRRALNSLTDRNNNKEWPLLSLPVSEENFSCSNLSGCVQQSSYHTMWTQPSAEPVLQTDGREVLPVCLISYCQTHLEPHQRVAGLKKHRLVEPMDRLEDRMCKIHTRLLELFCQNELVCVCQLCIETDHKSHPVVPLKEEYEVKTAQLGKIEAEVQQMIQEKLNHILEIKDTVKRSKADADRGDG
ncbi:unnamed protein product [Boreogadus saida]